MQIDIEPPYLVVKPDMTEDDFYRLADEDSNWEYLDGRIIMHSPASLPHEDLFHFLSFLIRGFLDVRGGAIAVGSRYPMRLDAHWSPEPDLLVVRDNRRHLMTRQRLEGPADMVIEIASDSDPRLDEREKLPRYREAGIEEIWLINPFIEAVRVERKSAAGYVAEIRSEGRLESIVMAGFWIDVGWLWQQPRPSQGRCLQDILPLSQW
jgi:Uma2 family endonuclease